MQQGCCVAEAGSHLGRPALPLGASGSTEQNLVLGEESRLGALLSPLRRQRSSGRVL